MNWKHILLIGVLLAIFVGSICAVSAAEAGEIVTLSDKNYGNCFGSDYYLVFNESASHGVKLVNTTIDKHNIDQEVRFDCEILNPDDYYAQIDFINDEGDSHKWDSIGSDKYSETSEYNGRDIVSLYASTVSAEDGRVLNTIINNMKTHGVKLLGKTTSFVGFIEVARYDFEVLDRYDFRAELDSVDVRGNYHEWAFIASEPNM